MPSRHTEQAIVSPAVSEGPGRNNRPWFLYGLIVVYLILAAAYNKLVPFESGPAATTAIQMRRLSVNPDEAAHVANGYVYKSGQIPVFHVGSPDFEAHQPPLYYILIAPLLAPHQNSSIQPAAYARLLSILIGAFLVYFVWAAVQEIFPSSAIMADAAACICLLPTNINVCASISNDALTNAVIAAAIWQMARLCRLASSPSATRQSLILGILLALGVYTKTSTLVLFPAVVVVGRQLARRELVKSADAVKIVAISCGTGLFLAAPWLIRNTVLYGDPVAQHIFNAAFTGTTATAQQMLTHVPPAIYFGWVATWSFASFWAVFDGMRLFLPANLYYLLAVIVVAQLIGSIRWLRATPLDPTQKAAITGIATVALATVLAFARFNAAFFQAQGRYLYPGLVFFGLVLATGTLGLLKRKAESGRADLVGIHPMLPYWTAAAMLILNLAGLYTLHSAYPAVG